MKRGLGAAALLICAACAVAGQNKPSDVVHYRQNLMSVIGWNVGPMAAMVKGKIGWDAKAFALRADRVAFLAPQALEGFADASDNGGVETDAKADIWRNFDDFKAKLDDFVLQSRALSDAARAGDDAKTKEQFHKTADACKACHEKYKAN
jgi:cytochrome c556